jgi:hypothetical protein
MTRRMLPRVCKNSTVIRILSARALAVNKANEDRGEENMLLCQAAQTLLESRWPETESSD